MSTIERQRRILSSVSKTSLSVNCSISFCARACEYMSEQGEDANEADTVHEPEDFFVLGQDRRHGRAVRQSTIGAHP
jgi:hypothetical protein